MKTWTTLFPVACVSFLTCSALATSLNLNPSSTAPVLGASSISVSYTAETDSFQAQGYVTDYDHGTVPLVAWGTLLLNATITDDGVLSYGTVTIAGDMGSGMETLLSGELITGASGSAYGSLAPLGGSIFEFQFVITGGNLTVVQDFGGLGTGNCGIILDAWFENGGVPFPGTWTANFQNDGTSGTAETFKVVPEPQTIALWLACLGGWGAVTKLQKRTQP
jgi:hypothetical protein